MVIPFSCSEEVADLCGPIFFWIIFSLYTCNNKYNNNIILFHVILYIVITICNIKSFVNLQFTRVVIEWRVLWEENLFLPCWWTNVDSFMGRIFVSSLLMNLTAVLLMNRANRPIKRLTKTQVNVHIHAVWSELAPFSCTSWRGSGQAVGLRAWKFFMYYSGEHSLWVIWLKSHFLNRGLHDWIGWSESLLATHLGQITFLGQLWHCMCLNY